jgi:enoyl-CoA hydratase/carnithine racemase
MRLPTARCYEMVMPRLLEVSRQDRTLRLSLNNPPANALSIGVLEAIQTELDAVRQDEAVRVVVISAEGGGLFSAGHDLKEMTAHRADPDGGRSFFEHTFALCSQVMRSIVELPQPVIAEVDGIATAAGCQLVASCDLAYASDAARFAVNGNNLGLLLNAGRRADAQCSYQARNGNAAYRQDNRLWNGPRHWAHQWSGAKGCLTRSC